MNQSFEENDNLYAAFKKNDKAFERSNLSFEALVIFVLNAVIVVNVE